MYLTTAKRIHRTSKTYALPCLEAKLKRLPNRSKGDLRRHLKASYVLMVRRSFTKIAHGDIHLQRTLLMCHPDISTGTLSATLVLGSLVKVRYVLET